MLLLRAVQAGIHSIAIARHRLQRARGCWSCAACHGARVQAIACYCLCDYRWPDYQRVTSRFGPLTPLAGAGVRLSSRLLPRLPLPATLVLSYDELSKDPAFNRTVKNDPLAGNVISLAAAAQLLSTPLPISFERFVKLPVLVLNPEEVTMAPYRFIRRAYDPLGTAAKRYGPIPGEGHWVLDKDNRIAAFEAVADWFDANGGASRKRKTTVVRAT